MAIQANYFKLGMFIIVGSLLLAAGVVVLGLGAVFTASIPMETYVDESVQGLEVGAPVKHRGVQIGTVSDIGFVGQKYNVGPTRDGTHPGRYVLVEADLEKGSFGATTKAKARDEIEQRVEEGLRIRMALSGITGVAYLEVDFMDPEKFPPPPINWTPRNPYIPAVESTFGRLLSATEAILTEIKQANIGGIARDLKSLLETANQSIAEAEVGQLSDEATALLAELRTTNERLREVLDAPGIEQTIEDVSTSVATIRRLLEGSEEDVSAFLADLPEVTSRLRTVADELETLLASEEVETTLKGLSSSAEGMPDMVRQLRRTLVRVDNLLAQQQADIQEIVDNLRTISANLVELSDKAKKYPSQMLFGEPPPRIPKGRPE